MVNMATPGDRSQREAYDFYATPHVATEALIKEFKFLPGLVWEPAVGKGHIADVFIGHGFKTLETDLHAEEHGRGKVQDFLTVDKLPKGVSTIITNPPYSLLNDFISHGLALKPQTLVIHCYLQSLGSVTRAAMFKQYPPAMILVLANRMKVPRSKDIITSKSNHIWIVWHGRSTDTKIKWTEAR